MYLEYTRKRSRTHKYGLVCTLLLHLCIIDLDASNCVQQNLSRQGARELALSLISVEDSRRLVTNCRDDSLLCLIFEMLLPVRNRLYRNVRRTSTFASFFQTRALFFDNDYTALNGQNTSAGAMKDFQSIALMNSNASASRRLLRCKSKSARTSGHGTGPWPFAQP